MLVQQLAIAYAGSNVPNSAQVLDAVAAPPRVGVCVTGEARVFVLPSVRTQLQRFLDNQGPNVVSRFALFRNATNYERFEMSEASLASEFPSAANRIELFETSTCQSGPASNATCCAVTCTEQDGTPRPPGTAFLQYFYAQRCMRTLLDEHRHSTQPLSWVVRVRPDLFYLQPLRITAAFADTDGMPVLPHGSNEIESTTTPLYVGDWFMAVPATTTGRRFINMLTEGMSRECETGDAVEFACTRRPDADYLPRYGDLYCVRNLGIAIARQPGHRVPCYMPILTTEQLDTCHRLQRRMHNEFEYYFPKS